VFDAAGDPRFCLATYPCATPPGWAETAARRVVVGLVAATTPALAERHRAARSLDWGRLRATVVAMDEQYRP
jgi:hypothetical protein